MERYTDQSYLKKIQYNNGRNLNARINLHQKYSTNKYGFHKWLFDQYRITQSSKILEVGCGTGELWIQNQNRIPLVSKIILSDFSTGMLNKAKENLLTVLPESTEFLELDVQNMPFEDGSFDIIIANHMLYHIPDISKAIREIQRVLIDRGIFYCVTNGKDHMMELQYLIKEFEPNYDFSQYKNISFTLENAKPYLEDIFKYSIINYEDSLNVTNVDDLLAYINSMQNSYLNETIFQNQNKIIEFKNYLQTKLDQKGSIFISKSSGLIIATKN